MDHAGGVCPMKIELTEQQFRYLLDLVYIGNWVINSTREDDRIQEYDQVESLVFSHCLQHKMSKLVELYRGELIPSRASKIMRTWFSTRSWPRSWLCGIWMVSLSPGKITVS